MASPSASPGYVGSSWIPPFSQITGLNWSTGQPWSCVLFSANPATWPRLLIMLATPLAPPSVGSLTITPFCHRKGRHAAPEVGSPSALKPQKSSPFGSEVSASPTAWPLTLTPNAALFCPPSPGVPISTFDPLYQRAKCIVPSGRAAAPLTKPLLVMKYGWPGGPPTAPRSVTV